MKLRETPPDACHLYKIPYTQETSEHWEFIFFKDGFNKQPLPIIDETTTAIDCKGNAITLDNPVYAIAGQIDPNTFVAHLKGFNVNLVEDIYIEWKIKFDDLSELTLYSDWFRREHCHIPVGIIKPCLDPEGTTTDINGDFVGKYDLIYAYVYTPFIGLNLPRMPRYFYSPQLYLRCGGFIMDGNEYEIKKVAKKPVRVSKKDVWKLNAEEIGDNYLETFNSVIGFARIFSYLNDRIFDLDEVSTPLKSRYMKHYYHTLNVKAIDSTDRSLGCGSQCFIQPATL